MPVHITTPRLQCAARCADAAAVVTKSLSRSVLLHMLISAAVLFRLCCLLYCAALPLLYCAALSLPYCAVLSLCVVLFCLCVLCMVGLLFFVSAHHLGCAAVAVYGGCPMIVECDLPHHPRACTCE